MTDQTPAADGAADASVACLTGDLTIYQASDLAQRMRDWLDGGVRAIDLSGVEQCDSAGLQLLLAAQQSARGLGQALTLAGPSQAIREIFSRYGLDEVLTSRSAG